MTLLIFTADRRAAVVPLPLGADCAAINLSCPPDPQQQTRHALLQQLIAGTDRHMNGLDTVPLHKPCHILCKVCKHYQ